MNLVFLDLEFIRYSKDYSFIVQIGAIKTDLDGVVIDSFDRLIKPNKITKINKHFWKLTKIDKNEVVNSEPFNIVYTDFEEWLDIQNVKALVTWGAEDLSILKNDLKRFKVKNKTILNKVYDYQDVFVVKDRNILNLTAMLEYHSINIPFSMHNALTDAESLKHIFFKSKEDSVKNLVLSRHFCLIKREVDSIGRIFAESGMGSIIETVDNYKRNLLEIYLDDKMVSRKNWLRFKDYLEMELMDKYIELFLSHNEYNQTQQKKEQLQVLRELILKLNRKFSNEFKTLESLREKIDKLIQF